MDKLKAAKAIMDKSENIKRSAQPNYNISEDYDDENGFQNTPNNHKYNIPEEYLSQSPVQSKPVTIPTTDAIKKSKLPDEIKQLMIEHPIYNQQPQSVSLSQDVIKNASRLMGNKPEPTSSKQPNSTLTSGIDYDLIKKMIDESIKSAIKEKMFLFERTEKTDENITLKIGSHIFEGKLTKIIKQK